MTCKNLEEDDCEDLYLVLRLVRYGRLFQDAKSKGLTEQRRPVGVGIHKIDWAKLESEDSEYEVIVPLFATKDENMLINLHYSIPSFLFSSVDHSRARSCQGPEHN